MKTVFYLIGFVLAGILWGIGVVVVPIGRESLFLSVFPIVAGFWQGVPSIGLLVSALLLGLPAALAVGLIYSLIDRTRPWMVVAAVLLTEAGSFVLPCLYFVTLSRALY